MKRSLYLLALSIPLMASAAPPPLLPVPQAMRADVIQVNAFDRFLEDTGIKKRPAPSQRSRSRSQASRNAVPKPPALASVPLPIPKPSDGDQKVTENAPAPTDDEKEKAQLSPAAGEPTPTPAAPDLQTATGQFTTNGTAPDKATPETPEATEPAVPSPKPAEAASGTDDQAAQPPVVEQPATATEPAHPAEVPKPLEKPETDGADSDTGAPPDPNKAETDKAGQDGTNAEKPAEQEAKPDGKQDEEGEKAETEPPPPPLVKEDPQELQACLADLKTIGAKFEPTDPINEGNGCGIEHPVDVAEVLPGVELGGATMRCKTALTMAHWLKDTVQPAMDIAMPGRRIVRLIPGSTYQCRLRNSASTGKISEHARGNAFDVAAFKLDNGETLEMKPRDEDSTLEGAFQRTATAGACLHFTTVLSPGSDAAHEDHLHLDILERSNGYRYCR